MSYAPAFGAETAIEAYHEEVPPPYMDGFRPQIDTNAARGIIMGLWLSAILWVGIIAAIWVAL